MNKKHNLLKIFIVIFCLCAVTLFALYQSGANLPFVQTYKNNFKKNVSGISNLLGIELPIEMQLYLDDMSAPTPKPTMTPADEHNAMLDALGYPAEDGGAASAGSGEPLTTKKPVKPAGAEMLPVAFSSADSAKFAEYKGKILCINETEYSCYSQKGELIFKQPIQMQSPMLTVRGDYVLINETGEKKISLYKGKKRLYTVKTEGKIITAELSEKGDVAVVTEKEYYKGQAAVYNKSGKLIFAWDSGSYDILDAAISPGRQLALSMLNTDSGADSFITCLGVDGKTRYKTDNFADAIIFELEYDGENLTAFADNKCFELTPGGKVSHTYDYDGRRLMRCKMHGGTKMLVFDTNGTGEIVTVTGGKAREPIKTESIPDAIDIKGSTIAYNSGRDIIMSDLSGKKQLRSTCSSDLKQLRILGSDKTLAVYSSSIQIKRVEKPKADAAQSDTTPAPSGSPEGQEE